MLCWILLTPAVLATASRTEATLLTVDQADSRELLSIQEVSAVARTVTATEVCYEVQRSQRYGGVGVTSGKLERGDSECVRLEDQDPSTKVALAGLAVGNLVRLRRSYFWVVSVVEHNGLLVKESTFMRPVTVLKVGTEVSRQVTSIQRVTTTYEGSTKSSGAHMVAPTGVDISSGQLACFKVQSEMNYISVPASDRTDGKLYKGEEFCIYFDSLNSTALATIRTFVVGDLVTVVVASEMVGYEWKDGVGGTESSAEWDFKFDLKKGTQRSEDCSEENATVTFEGAEAVSNSDGNYAVRFCFRTVERESAETLCFLNTVQLVATQQKLLDFTKGDRVHLSWLTCKVSFTTDDASNTQTATEENLIVSIGMGGETIE